MIAKYLCTNPRLNFTIRREYLLFCLCLISINLSLIIWSYYDCAPPVFDTACHLLSGFICSDLFAHPHFRSTDWWHSLLAVNALYPPLVYIVQGFFKLILGPERWVEIGVRLFFSSILFTSIYALAKLIFGRASVALLSALLIFAYPLVFNLANYDMLDLPGTAMVALALLCLTWWQQHSSIYSTTALGVSCVLATLTKNNSIGFLALPLLITFGRQLYKHNWQKTKSLLFAGLISLPIIMPWLIFASPSMHALTSTIQRQHYEATFINNFPYYLRTLPDLTSGFLFCLFIFAFCTASPEVHKRMLYISSSALSGILTVSFYYWMPQTRYELSTAIPMALYSAQAFVFWWQKNKLRPVLIIIALLSCFAFLENHFSPYPLPRIPIPRIIFSFFGVFPERTSYRHLPGSIGMYPTPLADWGWQWVFAQIKPNLSINKQYLLIMPSNEEVSSTTYNYLARQNKLAEHLHIFTVRNWTMLGDDVGFSIKTAPLIDWYLLKTGDQGSYFCSKASEKAYAQWCNFPKTSGLYTLVGKRLLPDGSELELYRKKG